MRVGMRATLLQVWSSHYNAVRVSLGLSDSLCSPDQAVAFQGCGDSVQNGGKLINSDYCILACAGDSSENCGGPDSYVLYVDVAP